ncbi:MAG: hypothetical protein ABIK83_11780 [Candidatus Zixiibacteriota bacterium]
MDQENVPQQQPQQQKKKRGCRTALIVVGIVFVVLIIGGYFACPHIAKMAIDKSISALETKVIEQLPDGYNEDEVHAIFDQVRTAFKEGKIKGETAGLSIKNASEIIQEALADGQLTPEETDKILETMKELAHLSEKK